MERKRILTVTLNPAVDYTVDVPDFRTGNVNRAAGGRRDPGGKGINAASITSLYRHRTAVTGFLGSGNSSIFRDYFEENRIDDRFIYIEGYTREGIKVIDPLSQITTDINFPGFKIAPEDLKAFKVRFAEIASDYDYVIMSGSLPADVPKDIYAELAVTASAAGVFTAVDTTGEALKHAVNSGCVNLIKPNIHELQDAFETADVEEADLLSRVEMVALSLGEEGSRLYTREGIFQGSAPEVRVASTVGAGDSFLGGLISGLAFGKDFAGALQLAAATAASKLTKNGPGWNRAMPPGYFFEKVEVLKVR